MRFALISDIHGNSIALDAVLADLDSRAVDKVVCLGDVVAMGPRPRETLARLQSLECSLVMGNTDRWLLDPTLPEDPGETERRLAEAELWSARQLAPGDLNFMRTFKASVEVALGNGDTLLCCHASPLSDTDGIQPDTPAEEVERRLAGRSAAVVAAGHTHQQMLRRFGSMALVNPGSVGQPEQTDPFSGHVIRPPWAEYALLEWAGGSLSIEFCRVAYDTLPVVRAIRESGIPHAETWAAQWRN